MIKTSKNLAAAALAEALGIPHRQPATLSDANQTVFDFMAGRSTPEPGTAAAELVASLQNGGTVEPTPRTINREELLQQLLNEKSPAAVLMRDLVRQELQRLKSDEGK